MTRRVVLAPWPAALGASFWLAIAHVWGCYRDPLPHVIACQLECEQ